MSENFDTPTPSPENGETEEQSFAELFEAYQSGMSENLKVGDKINGKIISSDAGHVFIDTGTKIDGVVELEELVDENGEFPHSPGDPVTLYVVAVNESEIRLSRAISGVGGLDMLREAFEGKVPVEGKVNSVIKGGFQVEVLHRRAFCPISQMDIKYVETPEDYVGKTYRFLIKRFEEKGRNIVLSRREILENEQKIAQKAFLEVLSVDSTVEGRITRLMPYGAFVELTPGIEGMIHISELSWSRVQKPEEAVTIGDTVRVKVLSIGKGKKAGEKKISLSIKQTTGDPWDSIGGKINVGDRLNGKVTRCMGFGVFVEILPGIEGLVHISEMSYVKRVLNPEDEVKPGDSVWVMVKEVDTANRRVSLSIRDAEGDPWAEIYEKYAIGQVVTGTFEKKANFGYFVNLEPGITGLLPKSKVGKTTGAAAVDKLTPGDPLTVTIDEIRPETRRISLGVSEARDEQDWKSFSGDSDQSLGSLGEQLKKALADKSVG